MPSIIQPSDFRGEYGIANATKPGTIENVQWYIDKYEPQLLEYLLGDVLYIQLKVGSGGIWTALTDLVKTSILAYVYFYYKRGNATETTGVGEVINVAENSTILPSIQKQVSRWNEMVENNCKIVRFINDNSINYGDYYMIDFPYCYQIARYYIDRRRYFRDINPAFAIFERQNVLNI